MGWWKRHAAHNAKQWEGLAAARAGEAITNRSRRACRRGDGPDHYMDAAPPTSMSFASTWNVTRRWPARTSDFWIAVLLCASRLRLFVRLLLEGLGAWLCGRPRTQSSSRVFPATVSGRFLFRRDAMAVRAGLPGQCFPATQRLQSLLGTARERSDTLFGEEGCRGIGAGLRDRWSFQITVFFPTTNECWIEMVLWRP